MQLIKTKKAKKLVYVNLWLWFSSFAKSPKINIQTHILFFDLLHKIAVFFYYTVTKKFYKKVKKKYKKYLTLN